LRAARIDIVIKRAPAATYQVVVSGGGDHGGIVTAQRQRRDVSLNMLLRGIGDQALAQAAVGGHTADDDHARTLHYFGGVQQFVDQHIHHGFLKTGRNVSLLLPKRLRVGLNIAVNRAFQTAETEIKLILVQIGPGKGYARGIALPCQPIDHEPSRVTQPSILATLS
jgi:hypothetical protein